MATKYAVNAGGNWDTNATWSTVSAKDASRVGDSTKPVAGDIAIIDDYSGSVTINGAAACAVVDCTGHTGTLTMNANMTTTGNVTLPDGVGGAFTPNTQTWSMGCNGSALKSNGKSFYNLTFNVNGTITLVDACNVTNTLNTTCVAVISTSDITCKNLTITTISTITGAGRTITMNNGTWTGGTTGYIGTNLTITGTSVVTGTCGYRTGTLNATGATLTTTGSTLNISTGCTFTDATNNWVNINCSASSTLNLSQETTITGNLSVASGQTFTLAGNNIIVGGNLTNNGTGVITGKTITMTGATGTATWSSGGGAINSNLIFLGGANTITVSGNVYYGVGTLRYTSGTMVLTGSTLNILSSCTFTDATNTWVNINGRATSTLTLSQATTISGNLTVDVANQTLTIATNDITIGGNLTTTSGAGISGTTRTITMTGVSGTATWSGAATSSPIGCTLVFLGGANTITVSGNVWKSAASIVYTSGTLVTTGSTLNVVGSFTFTDATNNWYNLNCSTTGTITLSQPTTFLNDLTVAATRTLTIGGVQGLTINGNITVASTGVLACGTNTITVLKNITNSSGSATTWRTGTNTFVLNGNTTITGSSTFSSLTINAGKTVKLTSGQTFAVTGTFTANGTSGSHINLIATTSGSQAIFNVTTVGTLAYIYAVDIDSSGGSAISIPSGSIDNTVNWSTPVGTGNTYVIVSNTVPAAVDLYVDGTLSLRITKQV